MNIEEYDHMRGPQSDSGVKVSTELMCLPIKFNADCQNHLKRSTTQNQQKNILDTPT